MDLTTRALNGRFKSVVFESTSLDPKKLKLKNSTPHNPLLSTITSNGAMYNFTMVRGNPPDSLTTNLQIKHNANVYLIILLRQNANDKMAKYVSKGAIFTNVYINENDLEFEILDDVTRADLGNAFLEFTIQQPSTG